MVKVLKLKEDRVKEGVNLLKQLLDAGIKPSSSGFRELKEQISLWTNSEKSWEGSILFPEYGRVADVDLPRYNNRAAGINFRVKRAF